MMMTSYLQTQFCTKLASVEIEAAFSVCVTFTRSPLFKHNIGLGIILVDTILQRHFLAYKFCTPPFPSLKLLQHTDYHNTTTCTFTLSSHSI